MDTWSRSILDFQVGSQIRQQFDVIIISNAMCYTMLCMLEWMRKEMYRTGTPRTRGLRDSALTAYIHEGIP